MVTGIRAKRRRLEDGHTPLRNGREPSGSTPVRQVRQKSGRSNTRAGLARVAFGSSRGTRGGRRTAAGPPLAAGSATVPGRKGRPWTTTHPMAGATHSRGASRGAPDYWKMLADRADDPAGGRKATGSRTFSVPEEQPAVGAVGVSLTHFR